jgi:hypothetical protein
MTKILNLLIKTTLILKLTLTFVLVISMLMISSEIHNLSMSNYPENEVFIRGSYDKLTSMFSFSFLLTITAIFDIKVLKKRNRIFYKKWIVLSLIMILMFIVSSILKMKFLGITFTVLITVYTLYLLNRTYTVSEKQIV